MIERSKMYPALKHGAYLATAILPGENQTDFEKLHLDLIAELVPCGVLEDDIVMTIARLIWRKQRLEILRNVDLAQKHYSEIFFEKCDKALHPQEKSIQAKRKRLRQSAEKQTRKELGDAYELVEVGEAATVEGLVKELEIRARLDSAIARSLKQLLIVRGVKSVSAAPPSASPKCITGPSEAA